MKRAFSLAHPIFSFLPSLHFSYRSSLSLHLQGHRLSHEAGDQTSVRLAKRERQREKDRKWRRDMSASGMSFAVEGTQLAAGRRGYFFPTSAAKFKVQIDEMPWLLHLTRAVPDVRKEGLRDRGKKEREREWQEGEVPGCAPSGSWAHGGFKLALRNLFIIVDRMTLMAASQDSELAHSHAQAKSLFKKGLCVGAWQDGFYRGGDFTVLWTWLHISAQQKWEPLKKLQALCTTLFIIGKTQKFLMTLCFWDHLFMKIMHRSIIWSISSQRSTGKRHCGQTSQNKRPDFICVFILVEIDTLIYNQINISYRWNLK